MKLSYDLHLHSCLSPCGDNDMMPNNIVGMAILKGLDLVALTDHNTCRNCPAFIEAARQSGLLGIPGMELTTAEEVHVVCLFPNVEAALRFDEAVYECLPAIDNRPAIFGEQLILNAEDEPVGTEQKLLINATSIPITDAGRMAAEFGGFAFPAHVDKSAYSVLANLGSIPPECGFPVVEVKNPDAFFAKDSSRNLIGDRGVLTSSDAHYLWDIAEPVYTLDLAACSINSLFEALRSGLAGAE